MKGLNITSNMPSTNHLVSRDLNSTKATQYVQLYVPSTKIARTYHNNLSTEVVIVQPLFDYQSGF